MVLITQHLCVLAAKEQYVDSLTTICSASHWQCCKRTAQANGTAVKKGQVLAKKGRKAVQSSASQVPKLVKATSGQKEAPAKASKAGTAIGTILGRAQGLSRKLVEQREEKIDLSRRMAQLAYILVLTSCISRNDCGSAPWQPDVFIPTCH